MKKIIICDILPFLFVGSLFIIVDVLALLATGAFKAAGVSIFQDSHDPLNLIFSFFTILLFTLVVIFISKFNKKLLLQSLFLGAIGFLSFYVLYSIMIMAIPKMWSFGFSIGSIAVIIMLIINHPEWYVIDLCGILMCVGSIAAFVTSLSVYLVIILLIGMSVYDAISVYITRHMIDLANTATRLKLPIVLVIPRVRYYSLTKETKNFKEESDEELEAFFIGLGDLVFPGILVVSAFYNISNDSWLVALSVIVGTLFGLTLLMKSVVKGKPQAGLPFLCSGAIFGYLLSSYTLFGRFIGL